jgi:hypothetical protein
MAWCKNLNVYLAPVIFLRHFYVFSKEQHSKQDVLTDILLVVNVSPLTAKLFVLSKEKIMFNL